jgi:hypothetical protein
MQRDFAISREDWLLSQDLGRRGILLLCWLLTNSDRMQLLHENDAIAQYFSLLLSENLLGKNVMTPSCTSNLSASTER